MLLKHYLKHFQLSISCFVLQFNDDALLIIVCFEIKICQLKEKEFSTKNIQYNQFYIKK